MAYQVLIGLNVLNDALFAEFREAIKPVLERHDGDFSYGFDVPANLLANQNADVNHVYTLSFASKSRMTGFFADKDYLKTRGRHVLKSFRPGEVLFGFEHGEFDATQFDNPKQFKPEEFGLEKLSTGPLDTDPKNRTFYPPCHSPDHARFR